MSDIEERKKLTTEEAIDALSSGDSIHTFRGAGPALLGCSWDRSEVIDAIKKYGAEISGQMATKMGHGIVIKDDSGHVFIETKKGAAL